MLQLLSPERVTNASTDIDSYVEDSVEEAIAPQPPTSDEELLGSIRIGWRDLAGETALSIRRLSQATVEQALEIGQRLLRMQRDLKRKEYATFLSVLGWASAKARNFINLAKTFSEFESSRLSGIELTTLLSLCSKRYQNLVGQLQEVQDITQQLVEELLKENRAPRKPKQEPISGWKQSRSGGGRFYNVLLHSEEVGLSIEQQAEEEGILPQKVIAEAVALRAQHKSGLTQPNEYRATHPEEQQIVVDDTRSLPPENSSEGEELPKSDRAGAELEERSPLAIEISEGEAEIASDELDENLGMQVAALAKEQAADCRVEGSNATNLSKSAPKEAPAQPPEPVQETACIEPSDDASANNCQLIKPDWDILQQLRDAEAGLRKIDNQIKELNDKLEPGSGKIVKRELSPVLKKQQNLRSAKISEIVETINSNSISAYYEELENVGRVVLNPKYASVALKQAKSWVDVVLVVGGDDSALLRAVKDWSYDSKQLLVQLLSTYLETEPSALEQINWVPEKLLNKALSVLSFTLEKIRASDNLVDEPEIEQICGCKFKSVANIGTPREQWFFQAGNKVLDVFGRSGFAVEKF